MEKNYFVLRMFSFFYEGKCSQNGGIYIPSARQSVSLGRNGHEGRLFFPRESFTFRDRREEGQVV